jgi:hypothetical protein
MIFESLWNDQDHHRTVSSSGVNGEDTQPPREGPWWAHLSSTIVRGTAPKFRVRGSAHPRFKGQIQAQNSLHGSGRRKPHSFNHIAYQLPYCK